ncbi:MAG: HAD family hydrolase [Streptosporangiaceae bacterium]
MTTVACTDLDRTLIYSAAALALTGPDAELPRLLCVELYESRPLSYLTEAAVATLDLLSRTATLVPTTTRTPEQYRRIQLPGAAPAYAICANGGHILVDGQDDAGWNRLVRKRIGEGASVEQVHTHLREVGGGFVLKLRVASGLFAYAVVDRAAVPGGWVAELTGWCEDRGWSVSLQGRKIYCIPASLTKSAAAAEVAGRAGAEVLLAAGDSLLDQELMECADAAIRPAHGELEERAWTGSGVAVTSARGVLAGEEIISWLLARALEPSFVARAGSWRTYNPV